MTKLREQTDVNQKFIARWISCYGADGEELRKGEFWDGGDEAFENWKEIAQCGADISVDDDVRSIEFETYKADKDGSPKGPITMYRIDWVEGTPRLWKEVE